MPISAAAHARNALASAAIAALLCVAAPSHAQRANDTPAPAAESEPGPRAQPAPRPARSSGARRIGGSRIPDPETDANLPSVELTPQVIFQILASEIAAQRGQGAPAAATYLQLARQTRDPRLARRATDLAIASQSPDIALQGARLWSQLSPRSTLATQTLEAVLLSSGQFTDAEPLLVQRLERARAAGELDAFYSRLGQSLARSPDPAAALAVFERLAARDPRNAEARLAAAIIAGNANDLARAAAESGRALALRPEDERTVVIAAGFARVAPNLGSAAAINLLENFLQRTSRAPDARLQLARLLADAQRVEEARTQMEIALRDRPDNAPLLLALARIAAQAEQWDTVEAYLTRYLALPDDAQRDEGLARLFLAQVQEQRGRPERAIEELARITEGEQRLPALARRAQLLGKLGRLDEARTLLSGAEANSARERTQLLQAEAQLLRDSGQKREAFELLDRALAAAPDNPELLYDHAMAAERLDKVAVMEASLRRLLAMQPDNAHAHNALGYSLADRGLRLDEAQALIERALRLSPEDPHIIDSMGWVLFRKGRLDEALGWLERAFRIKEEAEIGAHMGEVLWKLGRQDEARRIWQRARQLDPDNETLRETLARLQVSL
jgi:tetratricopeptide (TPR) repeat protein